MAEADKRNSLQALKDYYVELAERVVETRTRLEEERTEKLIIRKDKEKERALAEQWEKAERYKIRIFSSLRKIFSAIMLQIPHSFLE